MARIKIADLNPNDAKLNNSDIQQITGGATARKVESFVIKQGITDGTSHVGGVNALMCDGSVRIF